MAWSGAGGEGVCVVQALRMKAHDRGPFERFDVPGSFVGCEVRKAERVAARAADV